MVDVSGDATCLWGLDGLAVECVVLTGGGVRVVQVVTSDLDAARCPACRVVSSSGKEWVVTRPQDVPSGGGAVLLAWRKRRWRCRTEECPRQTFTEQVGQVPAGMRTTTRLREGLARAVEDGRDQSEVAAAHGVSWPTVQRALVAYAERELAEPEPTTVLGMDETRFGRPRWLPEGVHDDGRIRWRRSDPWETSLAELEQAALRGAPEQTRLTVVIEPTGPMWLPIAVYFGRGGHTVVRVSSAKAADLRRFLSRHAKSNGIDAETLARLPMVAPTGLYPVELGGAQRASLDRRVRTVARLTREIGQRKVRIRALAQTLIPTIGHALGDGLNRTDLAVLERYAHPGALLEAGRARLVRTESRGKLGDDKVRALRTAAEQALQLWGQDPAIALSDLAEEITTEIRLLRLAETERAHHEAARDAALTRVDPQGLATSVPGLGPVGATQLLAAMGRPGRFRLGEELIRLHYAGIRMLTTIAAGSGPGCVNSLRQLTGCVRLRDHAVEVARVPGHSARRSRPLTAVVVPLGATWPMAG